MLKFGRKLKSKASKDNGSSNSFDKTTDARLDERLSQVFANGIAVPVGPDGRIRQSESEVFHRRSRSVVRPEQLQQHQHQHQHRSLNSSHPSSTDMRRSSSSGRALSARRQRNSMHSPTKQHQRNHFYDVVSESSETAMSPKDVVLAFHPYDSRERSPGRSRSRSKSRERTWHARSTSIDFENDAHSKEIAAKNSSSDKKRKSKMEKIQQLQAKNELYKEEFKRVQKDRKQMKKDLEQKRHEITSLTKEIDAHIAETSILKLKLSEALQQLDRTDLGTRKDKSTLIQFNKELSQAQNELADALEHVTNLRQQLTNLQNETRRKNQQIESLTMEVAQQADTLESLHRQNKALQQQDTQTCVASAAATAASEASRQRDREQLESLQQENEGLQQELGQTLDRAANMVKEREDAIADLLHENDDLKRQVSIREEQAAQLLEQQQEHEQRQISEEEWNELKEELQETHASLEEAQDRNIVLEEELESWMARGQTLEEELKALQEAHQASQERQEETQNALEELKASSDQARSQAEQVKTAQDAWEETHREEMQQLKSAHQDALKLAEERVRQAEAKAREAEVKARQVEAKASELPDLESSHDDTSCDGEEDDEPITEELAQERQARMLEEAVAARRSKTGVKKGWFTGLIGEEEEELTEDQKRIKELEAQTADQAEEIQSLKSEVVRLRSTYNETLYTSKKKIEQLETDNEAHLVKVAALEQALTRAEV